MILAATGVHGSLSLLAVALAVTLIWHNGVIASIGPIHLQPQLPVMAAVPLLLAVAIAVSHVGARTPVIFRNSRTLTARGFSHAIIMAAAAIVLFVGDALAVDPVLAASMRNALFLSSLALLGASFAGVEYAWLPVLVAFGSAILSPADAGVWSPYALLISPSVVPAQVAVGAALCTSSLVFASWDPVRPAYLVRRHAQRKLAKVLNQASMTE